MEFQPRTIIDSVYGPQVITEPVLLELLDSSTLGRIKGISQLGLPQEYHYLKTFSRYEHCVGTMLLLRNLGGTLDEQIAGLLHDVSHTAFSHMIDWVYGSQENADYQDNGHAEFLRKSDVAEILARYGLDVEKYGQYHHFTLLEQDIPRLCADRVDYALRELKITGFSPEIVQDCADNVVNFNDQMVFNNIDSARNFGYGFLTLQREDWGNRASVGRYLLFSEILQDAIKTGIVSECDFYQDDNFVLERIRTDSAFTRRMEDLRGSSKEIPILKRVKGRIVRHKFRYVDPEFLVDNQIIRLSEADDEYRESLSLEMQKNDMGIVI